MQNDFPTADVGTATSADNSFREIGATLGAAVVGTIFTHRLTGSLAFLLPEKTLAATNDSPTHA